MDTHAPYGRGALCVLVISVFMKKGNKKDAPGVLRHLSGVFCCANGLLLF